MGKGLISKFTLTITNKLLSIIPTIFTVSYFLYFFIANITFQLKNLSLFNLAGV